MVIFSQLCKHVSSGSFAAHSCSTYRFLEICQLTNLVLFVSKDRTLQQESSRVLQRVGETPVGKKKVFSSTSVGN